MRHLLTILFLILSVSCCSQDKKTEQRVSHKPQPNIVWIVTEDISPTLSFYGDNTAKTPILDVLAKES